MSTSSPQRMANGSICIFFDMSRPKSSSVLMRMEPRREGRFMRRLCADRVRGHLSLAASSRREEITLGSTSEDSVLLAVCELQVCNHFTLSLHYLITLFTYLFCVSVSEFSDNVACAFARELPSEVKTIRFQKIINTSRE